MPNLYLAGGGELFVFLSFFALLLMLFLFLAHLYLWFWIFDVVFWVLHASGDEAKIVANRQRWR